MNPPKFNQDNEQIVRDWQRSLELKGQKTSSIIGKQWIIYRFLKQLDFKQADHVTKEDIEGYILYRRKNYKPKTVHNDIVDLRLFYKWLIPGNEFFKDIKTVAPRNRLPVDQLISPKDVMCLAGGCQSQRDRAIIMLLWDSAGRVSEVMDLNIGGVQFDQYGAVVVVDGKTGMRRIRLIDSVPDLQNWLNMHPSRDDPKAPLFVTTRNYGDKPRRVDVRTVQNMLKTVAKRAGVKKNIHPHGLRHAKLTDLVKKGFSEMELRIIAGWEDNSDMPAVYVHLSGADVENKILQKNGLIEEDEDQKTPPTKPIDCPRCRTKNAPDAKYCMSCSMVLSVEMAKEIESTSKQVPDALALLLSDPATQALIAEKMKEVMATTS